ncbi:MAG TPA: protein kinase [Vicinamibacterales bacterium]|nr:protein kinase [Vicinamibacterales bacterium]
MPLTDDRWRRVKALFQAAVELAPEDRRAFVSSAAGDDEDLRAEVESLLSSDARDAALLDRLPGHARAAPADALGVLASTTIGVTRTRPLLGPGRSVGSYEIIGVLGAGAMGDVYRARDARLNREVALKVVAGLSSDDPSRVARFRRESQLLAALNHPNIAAIYGVEESAEPRALVLELVDGPTLADLIAAGPMPARRALPIARQIIDALEAAHEQGIVHRDLKPANVKVRADGVVKVLDFGLAKALGADAGTAINDAPHDTAATREGIILGTAAYMSPEQAKGLPVDKRTDIWAFGCVLFEMFAGRPPFRGDTVTDVLAAVVKEDPDWTALPADAPLPVQRLLRRCLVKNPRQRLRDIGDARLELDVENEGPPDATASRNRPARYAGWLPWAAAVAIALSAVVIREGWRAMQPPSPLANATFTQFTNWEGNEEGAEISPNGELVAFLSDREGEFDLWVSQVGTGIFHNLTRDVAPLAASGSIVRKLGFTSDGAQIWFNPGDGKPPALMPWMGGPPQPFLPAGTNTPAWSPDGTSFVYVDKARREDQIYRADASNTERQQIFGPGSLKNMNPVWSPDGKWIYFTRGVEPQDETAMDVWRLRPAGGTAERVTAQHLAINFLAPLDSRRFLYVARAEDRSGPWLWSVDVDTGRSTRVPSGVDQYLSVSASRDGRRVVATVANPSASLWRVPLADRPAEERDAERYPLPGPTGFAFAPRAGPQSLFYLTDRGIDDGLWKVQDNRASQLRRAVDAPISEAPAVSRDGRLAVVVRKQGRRSLSVMAGDGTNAQKLAGAIEIDGAAGQGAADWSPDGTRIVAGGHDEKGPALFLIAVDTGVATRLVEGTWLNPVWSPRGDLIVYAGRSVIGQVELRGIRPDGTAVALPRVMVRPGGYRFVPDGSALVYVERIQSPDFWRLDLASGERRQLTRLENRGAVRTFDITPDGKYIVFDRARQNSNVVLIELPRQ